MNLPTEPVQATVNADLRNRRNTRLHGPLLVLLRSTWIILSLLALVLFIVSLPVYFAIQQQSYAVGYAVFHLALGIFVALVWFIVALLIFWRKSNDWLALLVSLMLVFQGANATTKSLETMSWVWQVLAVFLVLIAFDLLFLVFCLFPNGRFVPPWIGWLAVMFVVVFVGAFIVAIFDLVPNFFNLLLELVLYCFLGGCVVAQLYRYHAVSSQTERQQTKWIVFGVTATYLIEFAYAFGSALFPSIFSTGSLPGMILLPISNVVPILIPLSFGFAILHSHLWDIDIIIRRTLVYSTLTVVLAVIYEVSVFTLQSLTSGLTFIRGNQLAIVFSSFLIGGLFKPVYDRTHALIDRRFYRRKYDAAKTLATFNATIRDEVDLNQLCAKLTAVVEETMQPAHVSLWLCRPKRYLEETTRALPIIDSVDKP
jgi:hypothetical protein